MTRQQTRHAQRVADKPQGDARRVQGIRLIERGFTTVEKLKMSKTGKWEVVRVAINPNEFYNIENKKK